MPKTALAALVCLLSVASGQYWTGPYQLTTSPGADVNPSACKEWVQGKHTCLVWQSDRNGNWDIYSRCCALQNGNGWLAEKPVATTGFDEVAPAVCVLSDHSYYRFLCCWERRGRQDSTAIWAAFGDTSGWIHADSLAATANGPSDSSGPSAICIINWWCDSIWVVWLDAGAGSYRVRASCFDVTWCEPLTIHAASVPLRHVRVGRRGNWSEGEWPFVVWEQDGEILWSEFRHGAWTAAGTIAPSPARDWEPEIVSYMPGGPQPCGPWVTWTSERDGDTAVFGTPRDTFASARRWSDTAAAGRTWSPCGTVEYMTTDWEPFLGLCVSDRRGNHDIYDFGGGYLWNSPVDTSPATDVNPTLTTLGYSDATTLCWACWQSDRDGDWDIYGRFLYNTGIAEGKGGKRGNATIGPSIVRGVLRIEDSRQNTGYRAELLDISGRKVMELAPGENDIRHLGPGVYFVREANGEGRTASRKVVVTR